jgi:hypothetical protein
VGDGRLFLESERCAPQLSLGAYLQKGYNSFMTNRQKLLEYGAWGLSLLTMVIAFVAWGDKLHWKFNHLSTYSLFPLFGLLAFGLMWSHYAAAVARKATDEDKTILKQYFDTTSLAVLACLLLHPGLLIWQLWRDGYGLPPTSYEAYVAKGAVWVAILGSISLLVFLAYEFHRIYGDRKWWKYVQYASDIAMLAILYHGLRLGSTLHRNWLTVIWYIYGVSFISALVYLYIPAHNNNRKESK